MMIRSHLICTNNNNKVKQRWKMKANGSSRDMCQYTKHMHALATTYTMHSRRCSVCVCIYIHTHTHTRPRRESGPSSCRCTAGQGAGARGLVAPHRPTRAGPWITHPTRSTSPHGPMLAVALPPWRGWGPARPGGLPCVRGAVNRCTARKQSRRYRELLWTVDCEGQTAHLSMAHMLRFHALFSWLVRPGQAR